MRSSVGLRADVVVPERLDVTTVGLVRELLQLAMDASPAVDIVVDLSAVSVVDSAGLGLLVTTHRGTARLGRRLVLANPSPRLLRILAVTRLHRVLHVDRQVTLVDVGA